MIQEDTISAISTVIGESGIGIVRMSGENAIEIADKILRLVSGKKLIDVCDRSVNFGKILDSDGNIIDEVIVLIMRSPRSYTKEDVVELQCHGGMAVLRKVLSRTLEEGARLAERGEFTKRAFLNGRLDLSQAQAVLDVIQAKTETALKIAEEKLSGKTTGEIYKLKQQILDIISHIEALIDFPEDDIDDLSIDKIENDIKMVINGVNEVIEAETKGKILRDGIETAIIGKPNVGKSSLLNFLLKEEKAIVTDIPGTTRDIITEYININGIPLKIIDTAGIHNSTDKIEKIGIDKTKTYIKKAALLLVLFDGSRKLDDEDMEIIELVKDKNAIILITKSDLPQVIDFNKIKIQCDKLELIPISVKKEFGINELYKSILSQIKSMTNKMGFFNDVRELEILNRIKSHLEEANQTLKFSTDIDLISIDLRSALQSLDELTGESVDEDIINEIFSKFCIGK